MKTKNTIEKHKSMNWDIVILSFIQGIAEILPVSSSVNLHFFSKLFSIEGFSFSLKIALHAGSLLTLLIYFRKEIWNIFRALFGSKKIKLYETYFWQLFCATIPVVIFGFFARDFVKEFNSIVFMGLSSIFFGICLLFFDTISKSHNLSNRKNLSIAKSIFIGFFQMLAIFPGVSRLGVCITASRIISLSRQKAITFSMLLAIPSILGSIVLEVIESLKSSEVQVIFSNDFLIGAGITALIGLLIIKPAIQYMVNNGFAMLVVYRIIVGALVFLI